MLKLPVSEVRRRLGTAGREIESERRLPDETGSQLRIAGGSVVNAYDTGTVVVQGPDADALLAALAEPMVGDADPLREIRDLQRTQVERLTQLVGMYEQVLAIQQTSATAYQNMLRRMRLPLLAAGALIILILVVMLALVVRMWGRYG